MPDDFAAFAELAAERAALQRPLEVAERTAAGCESSYSLHDPMALLET